MNDNWKNYLKSDPIPMLLSSNPWTKYRTLTDLLDKSINDTEVVIAKHELLSAEKIIQLANETNNWIVEAATRNNDPKISYFKLQMLADFGLKYTDLNLQDTVEKATVHVLDNMDS